MKPPRIRTSAILSQHKQQSMHALHRRTTWKDERRSLRNGSQLFAGANIQGAPGATTLGSRRERSSYGSRRLDRACLNHLRNISSVSIISVKPALLIFTVETIEGGPG